MKKHKRQKLKWAIIGAAVAALIIIPFVFFGSWIEEWTNGFVESARARPWTSAFVLGGMLASDIFLPVPSSIVSTACGVVHGFVGGVLVSSVGMTISCLAGFLLAKGMGRPVVSRFVGATEMQRLQRWNARYGDWVVIAARPIPVLAEASVLFIGLGAMSLPRFVLLSTVSNLGISTVYAAAGTWSTGIHSFTPALAASIVLPWVLMRIGRIGRETAAESEHETDH